MILIGKKAAAVIDDEGITWCAMTVTKANGDLRR
jgi:hypothetical protein